MSLHYGFALNGKVEDKPLAKDLINGHSNGHVSKVAEPQPARQSNAQAFAGGAEIVKMQQLAIDGGAGAALDTSTSLYDLCPECGGGSLAYEEGCKKCYACGYSEC